MQRSRFRSRIPVPVHDLFAWHGRNGAFERLAPPWQRVQVVQREGSIRDGDILAMEITLGPLRQQWIAFHTDYIEGEQFRDLQIQGPFDTWVHTHRTYSNGHDASILDDHIAYELPLAPLSDIAGRAVRSEIRRMFRFRHLRTRLDLWRHSQYRDSPRLGVSVLGDHPLAGQVRAFLSGGGHEIVDPISANAVVDLRALTGTVADKMPPPDVVLVQIVPGPPNPSRQKRIERSVTIQLPDRVVGQSFMRPELLALPVVASRMKSSSSSWISEDDLIGLTYHSLLRDDTTGFQVAAAGSPLHPPGFKPVFLDEHRALLALSGRLQQS